jgi:hypothetical protein
MGKYARGQGVIVNMMSIVGAETNIQIISRVPSLTGGEMYRVNANNIDENMSNILNAKVIGVKCHLRIKSHKSIQVMKNIFESKANNLNEIIFC